jgi:hypothetical protein
MGSDVPITARGRMVLDAGCRRVLVVGCHGVCGLGSDMDTIRIVTLVVESLGLITFSLSSGSQVGRLPRGIFRRRPVGGGVIITTTTTMVEGAGALVLSIHWTIKVILVLRRGRVGGGAMVPRTSSRFRADCGAFDGATPGNATKYGLLLKKSFDQR